MIESLRKSGAAAWLARLVAKGPTPKATSDYDGDEPDPVTRGQLAVSSAYRHNVWAYAPPRKIAFAASRVTPVLYRRGRGADGKQVNEIVESHAILDLLASPGENIGWPDVIEATVWNLCNWGRAFIEKVGTPGRTVGFFPLHSRYVKVVPDVKRLFSGIVYTPNDREINIPAESLIFVKFFDPGGSDLKGLAPIEAAHHPISTDHEIMELIDAAFANGLTPGLVLKHPDAITRAQVNRLYSMLENRFRGAKKAFRPLILGGGLEAQQVGDPLKDINYGALRDQNRRDLMAAYDVPPIKLGQLDGASFANSREQNRHFWSEALPPYIVRIYDAFNRLWVWPEYGKEFLLAPDLASMMTDEVEKESKERRATSKWGAGIITLDEARAEAGYTPTANEDGKKYRWQIMPATPVPPGTLSPALPAVLSGAAGLKPVAKGRWDPEDLAVFAKSIADARDRHVPKVSEWALSLFTDQQDAILALVTGAAAKSRGSNGHSRIAKAAGLAEIEKDTADEIEGKAKEKLDEVAKRHLESLRAILVSTVESGAQEAIDVTGLDVSFNVYDPRVSKYLSDKTITLSRQINETTMTALKGGLRAGMEAGESIPQIEARVREAFGDSLDPNLRPEAIARTETADAANAGAVESYRQSGVVTKKQWLATHDDRVRDDHLAADGQQVDLDALFAVGGDELRWPGDTANGAPGNTINCRCTVISVLAEGVL